MNNDENPMIEEIQGKLQKIVEIDPANLGREEELGKQLNFAQGIEIFARTIRLCEKLSITNFKDLPDDTFTLIRDSLDQIITGFEQVKSFDLSADSNPVGTRDAIIDAIRSQYQSHFTRFLPAISYSLDKSIDPDEIMSEVNQLLGRMKDSEKEQAERNAQVSEDGEKLLTQIRGIAAESGVAQHAVHFQQQADEHKEASGKWLLYAIGFAVATLAVAGVNVWYYSTHIVDYNLVQTIQVLVAKLLIFSILYYGIIWCAKNYRAHQHNYVVNKHRSNALSSFQTFAEAASDEQTKNAVLLQSTQAIFSPQTTGFGTEESTPESPKILEVIRSIVSE